MAPDQDRLGFARDLLAFIDSAPTPHHTVVEVTRRLSARGFVAFDERESWVVAPETRGYVVRDGSVIAFVVGTAPPERFGFRILGAHTDSPNLRLKPLAEAEGSGHVQLSVEVYGGVLLGTWLDRDLGIAGKLVLTDGSEVLVRTAAPWCKIPNLAIHLNREVNKDGLILNPQQHLSPVLARVREGAPSLLDRLTQTLSGTHAGVRAADVLAADLSLFDVQAGSFGGPDSEFLYSARLDNLASCHAACTALIAASQSSAATRVIALYDHEEVGSQSATGARSALLERVLSRLSDATEGASSERFARALARSLLVSADMAHAVHPNYADKHDRQHRPELGRGPVVKVNVNQSYATDAPGAAAFIAACRAVDVSPQFFSARNDMPCCSTIGPISAARLGIRAVDVGGPMWGMHSCRETAAAADVEPMIRVLSHFLAAAS